MADGVIDLTGDDDPATSSPVASTAEALHYNSLPQPLTQRSLVAGGGAVREGKGKRRGTPPDRAHAAHTGSGGGGRSGSFPGARQHDSSPGGGDRKRVCLTPTPPTPTPMAAASQPVKGGSLEQRQQQVHHSLTAAAAPERPGATASTPCSRATAAAPERPGARVHADVHPHATATPGPCATPHRGTGPDQGVISTKVAAVVVSRAQGFYGLRLAFPPFNLI